MSSQVPVWFWRRMSRLMADQESRGDNGDSCSGKEDSVMWINLAEGCEAVNDETRRLVSLVWSIWFVWFFVERTLPHDQINQINKTHQINQPIRACRRVVLVGCFSV